MRSSHRVEIVRLEVTVMPLHERIVTVQAVVVFFLSASAFFFHSFGGIYCCHNAFSSRRSVWVRGDYSAACSSNRGSSLGLTLGVITSFGLFFSALLFGLLRLFLFQSMVSRAACQSIYWFL